MAAPSIGHSLHQIGNECPLGVKSGHCAIKSRCPSYALITYWLTAFLIPYMRRPATPVGVLWAVISTVFVYKDTRSQSLKAGISRLAATLISLLLCLS